MFGKVVGLWSDWLLISDCLADDDVVVGGLDPLLYSQVYHSRGYIKLYVGVVA
jgi:hypothetical protein